jgi:chemotaxis protein MotB
MSPRPAKKGGGGAPTWIVTFADLMSLLLTFFVLLLSFSNMEVDQFKKLAGAMKESFGLQSFERMAGIIELDGIAVGTAAKHVVPIPLPQVDLPQQTAVVQDLVIKDTEEPVQEVPDKNAEASRRTFNDLQTVMADEIAANVMDIIRAGNVTVVRFPDQVSFPSGSGDLKPEFLPVLGKFISILEESHGQIVISGHTDDLPISTEQYRSNWDLSASRAASVAHYILKFTSIPADRITVQGYADSRPLVPNDSPENRAKNRRVEITILQSGEKPTGETPTGEAPTGEAPPGETPTTK